VHGLRGYAKIQGMRCLSGTAVGGWMVTTCRALREGEEEVVARQQAAHQFDSFSKGALTLFGGCSPYAMCLDTYVHQL
jgi:hypothetical protein